MQSSNAWDGLMNLIKLYEEILLFKSEISDVVLDPVVGNTVCSKGFGT